MKNTKKKALSILAILLLFSLTSFGLELKYINTDYSFFSACQNYEITSDKEVALEKPSIDSVNSKEGSISNCQWIVLKDVQKQITTPIYNKTCILALSKNGTGIQNCNTTQIGTKVAYTTTIQKATDFAKETAVIDKPTKIQYCCDIHRVYSKEEGYHIGVDVIPTLSGKTYTELAWFNNSYFWRQDYNCSEITNKATPIMLNGTNGATINGSKQYIWTLCNDINVSIYYNNYDDYIVANSTTDLPFEVEVGDRSSVNPTSLWTGYLAVYHFTNNSDSTGTYDLTTDGSGISYPDCELGKCADFTALGSLSNNAFPNILTDFTIITFSNSNQVCPALGCGIAEKRDTADNSANFQTDMYAASDAGYRFGLGAGTTEKYTLTTGLVNNQWYFAASKITGTDMFTTINNTLNTTQTFSGVRQTITAPLRIGAFAGTTTNFQGQIDEVRIYNGALSNTAITDIYSNYRNQKGYGDYIATEEQTTTTTTTTTPTTEETTSTIPAGATPINKNLYIWSIMLPIFAFITMIYSFTLSSSKIKSIETKITNGNEYVEDRRRERSTNLLQPLIPLISTWLWYQSSFMTVNILFIDNFTVTASPYYLAAGNHEIGTLFTGLAVIMGLYTVFTIFDSVIQAQWMKGGK